MIEVNDLHKSFGSVEVLKGVELTIRKQEVVSVVGASGAGKSTLLHLIGTLDKPDRGTVKIRNEDVYALRSRALSGFRNRHIGFIFQFHHLLPEFDALENVCMPAYIAGTPVEEAEAKGRALLEELGLADRLTHKPNQLSGGEQQRVAVARSLINDPDVVLADEPSGNLDSQNSRELHTLFFKLRDKLGQTFLIVTHNQALADLADRKLTMQDGVIL